MKNEKTNELLHNCIQNAFDEMDPYLEEDMEILESKLFERLSNIYTGFSDGAESAIVDCCKETFKVSSIFIEAYINTTLMRVVPTLKSQILAELRDSLND